MYFYFFFFKPYTFLSPTNFGITPLKEIITLRGTESYCLIGLEFQFTRKNES